MLAQPFAKKAEIWKAIKDQVYELGPCTFGGLFRRASARWSARNAALLTGRGIWSRTTGNAKFFFAKAPHCEVLRLQSSLQPPGTTGHTAKSKGLPTLRTYLVDEERECLEAEGHARGYRRIIQKDPSRSESYVLYTLLLFHGFRFNLRPVQEAQEVQICP